MATDSGAHQNPIGVFLVIVLATVSVALGVMRNVVPDVDPLDVNALAAPCSLHSCDGVALTSANTVPRVNAVPAISPISRSPRIPMERFSGEGAGRKVLLATSSEDKRAFLLNTAASLRKLTRGSGCELVERPLGGTTRRCASSAEKTLVAISPGIVN